MIATVGPIYGDDRGTTTSSRQDYTVVDNSWVEYQIGDYGDLEEIIIPFHHHRRMDKDELIFLPIRILTRVPPILNRRLLFSKSGYLPKRIRKIRKSL